MEAGGGRVTNLEMAKSTGATIGSEAKESITERLSLLEDLYFPRKVQPFAAADPSHRKSLLLHLLSTDAAVFLERYGSKLSLEELNQFDVLKDDYEISWHLNHLRSIINPTEEERKSKSARIKNRRLAYMDKLVLDGHYFSEDAMREREPYLHHEYVGKFQDPSGRSMARPGERWSETLMRRSEEAILVEKIRGEQQRLGVAQSDWVGNEREMQEEEEEEEEEEDESETEVTGEEKQEGVDGIPTRGSPISRVASDSSGTSCCLFAIIFFSVFVNPWVSSCCPLVYNWRAKATSSFYLFVCAKVD